MTVNGVIPIQGLTEVHFELGGSSNSSSCHGQPYDSKYTPSFTLFKAVGLRLVHARGRP